jgi:hypothetical protein
MKNEINFSDIEAIEAVHISKDGKIWGLTKYKTRGAFLVIPQIKRKYDELLLTEAETGILKEIADGKRKKAHEFIEEKNIAKKNQKGEWELTDNFVSTYEKAYAETDEDEESVFQAAVSNTLCEIDDYLDTEDVIGSYICSVVTDLVLNDQRLEHIVIGEDSKE